MISDDAEELLEQENDCICPDIWDCPYCLYNCMYCSDIRDIEFLSETK